MSLFNPYLNACLIICMANWTSEVFGQQLVPIQAPARGSLSGKITFVGQRPDTEAMTKQLHARAKLHRNADVFFAGSKEETSQQEWRIDEKDGVGNVLVWLQPPKGTVQPFFADVFVWKGFYFVLDADDLKPGGVWKEEVVLDAPHCTFLPHVFALFLQYRDPQTGKLKPTGQTLVAKNSTKVAQQVSWRGDKPGMGLIRLLNPSEQFEFHIGDPRVNSQDQPLVFRDEIHPWNSAYSRALDHPFVAVSSSNGAYEIKNAPAGIEVRVVAWHEKAGFLNGKDGQKITLKKGANTIDFELRPPK
jgi:hypothetical protein